MERSSTEKKASNPPVFCLPFAGGSGYSYNGFKRFAKDINIVSIELPGRGRRMIEDLISDIDQIADDVFNQVRNELHRPYAIYGHSMGAIVAYLVTRKIEADLLPKPMHLFVSGRGGPSLVDQEPPSHQLPKDLFIEKLKEIGGSSPAFLDNPDLIDHFEPILRSDFKAVETYRHQPGKPLDVGITCMIGTEEEITDSDAQAWQLETTFPAEIVRFTGNHFFIFDHEQEIIRVIERTLATF